MDKYEYKVRAEEINSLIEQKKYAEAVKIADTIDWRRVKSAKMLCKVSELYKMNRRYEDSKEILLLADDHLPDSRNIIYSLCELSIKLEDLIPAIEYYKKFIQIAPHDTKRYILQYRLYEAQDVSLEERIAVLEEYKKRDYCEKWGYELAYLYHRVGLATRCVEECDELILWFGEGKYVIKAMELKMLHAPLTSSQQEKYDRRFETESTAYVVKKPDESREAAMKKASLAAKMLLESANEPVMSSVSMETIPSMPIQIKSVEVSNAPTMRIPSKNVQSQLENGGDTVRIDVPEIPLSEPAEDVEFKVKTMDVGKYNTINLQKELAENLAAVMQQEDMEASDATRTIPVDSINNLMPEETAAQEDVTNKEEIPEAEEPTIIEDTETEETAEEAVSEDLSATREFKPISDTAVTRAVIEEVRKALGDEPRETITEEDLLNSLNEQPKEEPVTEVFFETEESSEEPLIEPLPGIFSSAPVYESEMNEESESAYESEPVEESVSVVEPEVTDELAMTAEAELIAEIETVAEPEITEEPVMMAETELMEETEAAAEPEITEEPVMMAETEPMEEPEITEESVMTAETELIEEPEENPIIIESIPQSEIDEAETLQKISAATATEPESDDFHNFAQFEYTEPVIIPHEEEEPEPITPIEIPPVVIEEPIILQTVPVEPVVTDTPIASAPVTPAAPAAPAVSSAPQPENPDAPLVEKQITGQLTFNDIVAGWEGTKKAAEERRLEEMRKKALAETGPMFQNNEPENTVYPTDLNMMAPVLNVFDKATEPAVKPVESVITPEDEVEELTDIKPPAMDTEEINGLEEKLLTSYESVQKQQITTPLEPIDISGISTGNTDQIEIEKKDFDSELERQVLAALEEAEPISEQKAVFHTADFKIDAPAPESKAIFHTADFKIDEPKLKPTEPKPIQEAVKEVIAPIAPTPPRHEGPRSLTKEEKDLFGALAQTKKMQEDIANAIDNISLYPGEGNVLITGEKGVGTIDLAKTLIKVLASVDNRFSGRVAKVTGEQFNTRNIKETLNGLGNGALIVEHAGELTDFALIALSDYLRESHQDGIVLFFEDTKMGMGSLCAKENMPMASFNLRIDISVLDNDGLVNYGKDYALEQDYSIDELGVLALYTKISERQTIDHAVTIDEVKQIVDEAIRKSQKGNIGHFMDVILKKRYDDDDMIILREKDFL